MPEIILSDYFCSDESEEFVYFKVPRRHEQYKFPLCFTKGHFSKTAELWHFLRLIRQGATRPPCLFMPSSGPGSPVSKSMARRPSK